MNSATYEPRSGLDRPGRRRTCASPCRRDRAVLDRELPLYRGPRIVDSALNFGPGASERARGRAPSRARSWCGRSGRRSASRTRTPRSCRALPPATSRGTLWRSTRSPPTPATSATLSGRKRSPTRSARSPSGSAIPISSRSPSCGRAGARLASARRACSPTRRSRCCAAAATYVHRRDVAGMVGGALNEGDYDAADMAAEEACAPRRSQAGRSCSRSQSATPL